MSKTKKNGKTTTQTLPGLPAGAPEGSFPLTAEEINEFRSINTEQRLLQSEADKLQLRQNNTFLQIQIRTSKKDLTGWGVDIQRGMCVPPQPIKEAEKAS